MTNKWTDDPARLESLADHLLCAMSMFPKRMIRIDEIIRDFQMPLSHIQVLTLVSGHELTISQLSARLGVAKPNVTPLVNALGEKGYVTKVRGDGDKRTVRVVILPPGEVCLAEIRKRISQQIQEWPIPFTAGEIKRLNTSLGTLNRTMEAMNEAGKKETET